MKGPIALALLILASPVAAEQPGRLVDPFVGTLGDHGQMSPAASSPYGMVQLGPDTDPANHAGYNHAAKTLTGFSHTRAIGVGCGGAGGDLKVNLGYAGSSPAAIIDKAGERGHAGYYRVRFGAGIIAEATATRGAGVLRFTVPRTGRVVLRIDPRHSYSKRLAARWHVTRVDDLRASLSAGTVCDAGAYHLHTASTLTHRGKAVAGSFAIDPATQEATLNLAVRAGDTLELRTGLSSVDPTAAAMVRDRELGQRRFTAIARATLAAWNAELDRIRVTAPRDQRALFHTALFRVMQSPIAIADPDGRFRGSDGKIAIVAPGHQHYTGWALWDNYRTQLPLIALIDPARAGDIARSLVALYGAGKQRWATKHEPFITVRTEHAGVALLDFHRKGVTGFDLHAALAGMIAESPTLARRTPDEQIEAAYDDWAIAQLAKDLGQHETADRFLAQALEYRTMWRSVFETLGDDADVVKARGLYQGTLWQYRWAAVFDLPWLAETLGPRFRPDLDRFFAGNLFNMTNQPDIHVPYLFAWHGDRAATARIVKRYLTQPVDHAYANEGKRLRPWHGRSFALAPQGFADGMDDDAGTMTAWYVWSALGLYPLVPGEPAYVLAAPSICGAEINTGSRATLRIRTTNAHDSTRREAQQPAVSFDGEALDAPQIAHSILVGGRELSFAFAGPAQPRCDD